MNDSKFTKRTMIISDEGEVLKDNCIEFFAEKSNNETVEFSTKGSYLKLPRKRQPAFSKAIYFSYLYSLLCSIDEINRIVGLKNGHAKILEEKDIMRMLSCGETSLRTFMAEAKRLDVIGVFTLNKQKAYFINPAFGYIGRKLHKAIFMLFSENATFLASISRDSKRNILEKWNIDIDELLREIEESKTVVRDEFIDIDTDYCLTLSQKSKNN